jgi:hypothetical protein
MKAKKAKKLPEELFVRYSGEGEDEWLNASTEAETLVDDAGETCVIGTYQLVATRKAKKSIAFEIG